jgi:hypothetical protein
MPANSGFAVTGAGADGFDDLAEHVLVFYFGFVQVVG